MTTLNKMSICKLHNIDHIMVHECLTFDASMVEYVRERLDVWLQDTPFAHVKPPLHTTPNNVPRVRVYLQGLHPEQRAKVDLTLYEQPDQYLLEIHRYAGDRYLFADYSHQLQEFVFHALRRRRFWPSPCCAARKT